MKHRDPKMRDDKLLPGFPLLLGAHMYTNSIINTTVYQGPCLLWQVEIRIIPLIPHWLILRFHTSVTGHQEMGLYQTQGHFSPCQVLVITWCNFFCSRWQPSMKWVCMHWRTPWPADQPRGWWPLLKVSGGSSSNILCWLGRPRDGSNLVQQRPSQTFSWSDS